METVVETNEKTASGKPKRPSSKEKLMAAGTELCGTRGFGRTSVHDLLKAAGVTKSNFYYHFASKDVLGMEVLKGMQESMKKEVWPKTLNNPALAPLGRIESFVNCVTETLEENGCNGGCPFANLAIELSDEWPSFRAQLAEFFKLIVTQITACVREGQAAGQIRRDVDPVEMANLVFTQLEGAVLLAKTYKDVKPIRQSFSAMAKLMQS